MINIYIYDSYDYVIVCVACFDRDLIGLFAVFPHGLLVRMRRRLRNRFSRPRGRFPPCVLHSGALEQSAPTPVDRLAIKKGSEKGNRR